MSLLKTLQVAFPVAAAVIEAIDKHLITNSYASEASRFAAAIMERDEHREKAIQALIIRQREQLIAKRFGSENIDQISVKGIATAADLQEYCELEKAIDRLANATQLTCPSYERPEEREQETIFFNILSEDVTRISNHARKTFGGNNGITKQGKYDSETDTFIAHLRKVSEEEGLREIV